jgi:hypothetical protein
MTAYYENMRMHNYDKALKNLEGNKLIKKNRNQLLYFLEVGKAYRLKDDPVQSNRYLNLADNFIENTNKSAADIALGNLLNPMQQTYRGEDFERFMIHYYKALNYSAMGQIDDAVVEARRIGLSATTQADKFNNKENRYSKDAFALNLQGMIYEMAGDMNNAFISYRNAADIYLKANDTYYGVTTPRQLMQDLLKASYAMGFTSETGRYEKLFNTKFDGNQAAGGELILFLEEGQAPVKEEKNFVLTSAGQVGNFNFIDPDGHNSNIPFNYHAYNISESKLSAVRALRVAIPVYRIAYQNPAATNISVNGKDYKAELAQNLNNVAVNVLKERFLTEMANALARQLTKKLVEKGTQAAAEGIAKKRDKKSGKDTDDEAEKEKKRKRREENAKAAGEAAGFVMNMVNTISEKADTRNWQSLPAFISYIRIPLSEGENEIHINSNGKSKLLKVNGGKGIQMIGTSVD